MKFIGLAALIYLGVYKVDANSTISEITLSPSKEIDISSGPVSVILSFEFTMGSACAVNCIGLWYDGGYLDAFSCAPTSGFDTGHDKVTMAKLFGSGPYEASKTKCVSLPSEEGDYCDIAAGKMAVRVEYSLQSLTSATNVWRAALLNVYFNGSQEVGSGITTPPAITTVGVLTRNLTIHTSVFPDGSIIMHIKCTIGPVIPDIELMLTLPPGAETGPTKGNNSVSVQILYDENLDGARITCDAYIVHPRPAVLPETKDVEYAPMYFTDYFKTVCQIPCQLNHLCSLHLVAYPKAAVTFWWSPDEVTNGSVISVDETVTIECTARNPLGNAKRTIIAHVTKTSGLPTVQGNPIVWAVSIVPAAIFLLAIGAAIFLFSRRRKVKRHQENTSQGTNNNQGINRQQISADVYRPLLEPEGRSEHDYDSLHWGGQGQTEDNHNQTTPQSSPNNSITSPEAGVPLPIEPVLSAAGENPDPLRFPTSEYQPFLESVDSSEHDYNYLYLGGQGQTEGHQNQTNQQSSRINSIVTPETGVPLPIEPVPPVARKNRDPRFPTHEYQPLLESSDRSEHDYNYLDLRGQGQTEGHRNQTNQQSSSSNSISRPEQSGSLPIFPPAVRENRDPRFPYAYTGPSFFN